MIATISTLPQAKVDYLTHDYQTDFRKKKQLQPAKVVEHLERISTSPPTRSPCSLTSHVRPPPHAERVAAGEDISCEDTWLAWARGDFLDWLKVVLSTRQTESWRGVTTWSCAIVQGRYDLRRHLPGLVSHLVGHGCSWRLGKNTDFYFFSIFWLDWILLTKSCIILNIFVNNFEIYLLSKDWWK